MAVTKETKKKDTSIGSPKLAPVPPPVKVLTEDEQFDAGKGNPKKKEILKITGNDFP